MFSALKLPYCALGESGPAREKLSGKLFCFRSDFFQIFRVNYPFVLAESFIRRVQGSGFGHHGEIGTACPAGGCLFADVMKLACAICLRTSRPIALLVGALPLGLQNLLSARDRMWSISSSIVVARFARYACLTTLVLELQTKTLFALQTPLQ
jgi:hypothetical protein